MTDGVEMIHDIICFIMSDNLRVFSQEENLKMKEEKDRRYS
jgi:hypothetical protein